MKKVLPLVALLAAWTLILTGCEKTENVEEVIDETGAVEETNLKTSLDLGELIWLIETHFPKSYEYSTFNTSDNLIGEEGKHIYNRMEFGYLTPEYSDITDREVVSSGIEDDMIYTLVDVKFEDGRTGQVLYINNPETLDFVAASVEEGDNITNYQFSYEDITSLTYEDLEGIAEKNFPISSTYTKVVRETEESNTGDYVYPEGSNELSKLTPDFLAIAEKELLSSGIEDGMIYTNFDVVFDNDTTGNVLYINDPETLNFVAATVESAGIYVNYQFAN